ncbi:hypothetical protein DBR42_29135 [Pelomonas sp. HMWF004]|nr:hypothetical protein DBR42_29135 [Pelomonas sp. HMWF004]
MTDTAIQLAKALREACDDARTYGNGFINTTRVMEIVEQHVELGTPCEFCGKEVMGADAGPPCMSQSQASRCDAMKP